MTTRGGRVALCCLAILFSVSLYVRGRVPTQRGESAAFFVPAGAREVTVRLAGDLPRPGIYRFPAGTSLRSAIKMTAPELAATLPRGAAAGAPLASGDVVTLRLDGGQLAVLSKVTMPARERMLLGIPLDPDLLSAEEWELLPGIGPVLASRIVEDRHNNGAFGALRGVLRVRGIGPGKLKAIARYF